MEKLAVILASEKISDADWEKTPDSIKRLIGKLLGSEERLREQLGANSQNTSKPPSSDQGKKLKKKPKKSGKSRGGQIGHPGQERKLYELSECLEVHHHLPDCCSKCGSGISTIELNPHRHQIVELPEIKPLVTEHRFYQGECSCCGSLTRDWDSDLVNRGGYGARLIGQIALLSGMYRQSERMIQQLLSEICQIDIGVGTIAKLRMHVSEALEQPVQEAHQYVLTQPLVNMDETGFQQGNADGNNPTGKKAWLWVMSTPLVIYFSVTKSRSTDSAVELLSEEFEGILGSDRYSSYNWVNLAQRQLCWAHLKRDFQRIAERSGVSAEIGQNLLAVTSELFDLWYEVRAGTLSRAELVERVIPIRATLLSSLQLAAKLEIGVQEKTPLAKTVRTCRQLLKVEPALWTFIYTEGIEPTNNAAERAIRPAVLWRKNSFGSQSEAGSLFVARMMTVVSTLRAQGRQVLDYLVASLEAHRSGHPSPSILPLG